jgi:hypothetical protein
LGIDRRLGPVSQSEFLEPLKKAAVDHDTFAGALQKELRARYSLCCPKKRQSHLERIPRGELFSIRIIITAL